MRVLITGAAGFVGRHTASQLRQAGHEPLLTDMRADHAAGIASLDICSAEATDKVVRDLLPDACIHLAGVAFVPDAARDPTRLTAINVDGPLNVARALLRHSPRARLLFISSAQVYGFRYREAPMTEADELRPGSPYACSKAQAEAALLELAATQGLDVVIARPGNHTGPGQAPRFVVPSFIHAVRDFRDGRRKAVSVGNLDSERDFTDVRDVVAAYLDILQKGASGGIFNISAGMHLRIGDLLTRIAALGGVEPRIVVDPSLYRPTDAMPRLDTTRLRELGWKPRHTFDQTLADIWAETEAAGK